MEKFKWAGNSNGKCWECGKAFPVDSLAERADEGRKQEPNVRRAFTKCPAHNYGDVAIFEGDWEWSAEN